MLSRSLQVAARPWVQILKVIFSSQVGGSQEELRLHLSSGSGQYFWDAGTNREVTPRLILPGHPNARHSSIAVPVQVGKLRHWAVKHGAETGGGQLFLGLGETPGLGKVMAGQR